MNVLHKIAAKDVYSDRHTLVTFGSARTYPESICPSPVRSFGNCSWWTACPGYGLSCPHCSAPMRLFQDLDRVPSQNAWHCHPDHCCQLCEWKKDNKELSRLLLYRLFPALPRHLKERLATFLHTEGDHFHVCLKYDTQDTTGYQLPALIQTPSLNAMCMTARLWAWQSVLLTGYRWASSCEALATRGHPGLIERNTLPAEGHAWKILPFSLQNPFWAFFIGHSTDLSRPFPYLLASRAFQTVVQFAGGFGTDGLRSNYCVWL